MPLSSEDRARIAATLGEAQGSDLAAHLKRDAIFVVSSEQDLLAVAIAVAEDDAVAVGTWLDAGELRRPTEAEGQAILAEPERPWRTAIVQPFVFAQPL